MALQAVASLTAMSLGVVSLGTAPPLLGVHFPNKKTEGYYYKQNLWWHHASGTKMSTSQCGQISAAIRILTGLGLIIPQTRILTLAVNLAVVAFGALLTLGDDRTLKAQLQLLFLLVFVLVLEKLAGY